MRLVALVSGGKDGVYNALLARLLGHDVLCLANLYPPSASEPEGDELDSHCFQTVGHTALPALASCMGLPLIRRQTKGLSHERALMYACTGAVEGDEDEVEDLAGLLKDAVAACPGLQGVAVGAVLSSYQRLRVEAVATRLGLTPVALLWQREQLQLFEEMVSRLQWAVHRAARRCCCLSLTYHRPWLHSALRVLPSESTCSCRAASRPCSSRLPRSG